MYEDNSSSQMLVPAGSGDSFKSLDNLLNDSPGSSDTGEVLREKQRRKYPEPINSDITRDHWLEMPGCYDRITCLPVHQHKDKTKDDKDKSKHHSHNFSRQDYHECLKTWKYAQYHDECCFFHSLGALEGGENKHPEGCTQKLWPDDNRYYEGRQNYAEL